jgi:hypothetical protein
VRVGRNRDLLARDPIRLLCGGAERGHDDADVHCVDLLPPAPPPPSSLSSSLPAPLHRWGCAARDAHEALQHLGALHGGHLLSRGGLRGHLEAEQLGHGLADGVEVDAQEAEELDEVVRGGVVEVEVAAEPAVELFR